MKVIKITNTMTFLIQNIRLIERLFHYHLPKLVALSLGLGVTIAAIAAWWYRFTRRRQRMLCRPGLCLVPKYVNQALGHYYGKQCGFTVEIGTLGKKPMWTFPKNHRDNKKYIFMSHETEYWFRISVPYDGQVVVKIDGHFIGCWLFEAGKKYNAIRCGVKSNRQFTFLRLSSREGRMAGLSDNDLLGLIEFFYRPKRAVPRNTRSLETTRSSGTTRGFSAGGTGLGRTVEIDRVYGEMDVDYDYRPLALTVRLTCVDTPPAKPQYVHVSSSDPPPRLV